MLVGDVDTVAACLTQAATDALVSKDNRGQIARVLDRVARSIDLGVNTRKLDGVIARVMTLINAKLTRLLARVRQTRLQIEFRQPDAADAFLGQWNRTDRAGRTNLSTDVTTLLTPGPVCLHMRSP